jgi:hypothetical protein
VAIRFPPLSSPGHPSAALNPLWAVWLRRPRRRTQRTASAIRRPLHEVTPRCSVVGLANGQSPTEPNRPRLEANLPPRTRHPQYAATPERSVSWGSTTIMSQSLARPEPASLYKRPRNGCLQDKVRLIRGLQQCKPL